MRWERDSQILRWGLGGTVRARVMVRQPETVREWAGWSPSVDGQSVESPGTPVRGLVGRGSMF